MSLINVTNLTFGYDGSYDNVFENVSFQLDTDWRLGFTGRNGRGKTTFLKLLMGAYEYLGSISASVSFDYFPLAVADASRCTADVIDSVCHDFEPWELQRELSLLDVDYDVLERPFCTLSSGEQTKALLAALFLKQNNFLLIDEPTNHLDAAARALVSDYLNRKSGYILVSHDRAFLDRCVDHVLSINKTDIEVQAGNFSSWLRNKEQRDTFELAENERLRRDMKRLSAAAKRTANWSEKVERSKKQLLASGNSPDRGHIGHMAAKMMKRSKSIETRREAAVAETGKLLKNLEEAEHLSIHPLMYHTEKLVELTDISVAYDAKSVCEKVSFTINSGDRTALRGKNGCGKSSIIKLILGEEIPHSGTLAVGSQLIISYVSQDTAQLKGDLRTFARQHDIDEALFKAILRKLDFSRQQLEKEMEDFSGGQKKKVLLARSLCDRAHLYLWDEPLNFIDVLSRIQLEELILEHQPTMLFVEHDSAFCARVATKTVDL